MRLRPSSRRRALPALPWRCRARALRFPAEAPRRIGRELRLRPAAVAAFRWRLSAIGRRRLGGGRLRVQAPCSGAGFGGRLSGLAVRALARPLAPAQVRAVLPAGGFRRGLLASAAARARAVLPAAAAGCGLRLPAARLRRGLRLRLRLRRGLRLGLLAAGCCLGLWRGLRLGLGRRLRFRLGLPAAASGSGAGCASGCGSGAGCASGCGSGCAPALAPAAPRVRVQAAPRSAPARLGVAWFGRLPCCCLLLLQQFFLSGCRVGLGEDQLPDGRTMLARRTAPGRPRPPWRRAPQRAGR